MGTKRSPEQLAEDLLKLLTENAKPVITRTGSNRIKIQAQGKTFEFDVSSRTERQRRDIS